MAFRSDFVRITCEGSPREMGLAQGRQLAAKIHAMRDAMAGLEAFRLLQPRWVPYGVFRRLSEQKAWHLLSKVLPPDSHPMGQRLAGIAEGAGMSRRRGAMHALWNCFRKRTSSIWPHFPE